jgi:hypothetical protein
MMYQNTEYKNSKRRNKMRIYEQDSKGNLVTDPEWLVGQKYLQAQIDNMLNTQKEILNILHNLAKEH